MFVAFAVAAHFCSIQGGPHDAPLVRSNDVYEMIFPTEEAKVEGCGVSHRMATQKGELYECRLTCTRGGANEAEMVAASSVSPVVRAPHAYMLFVDNDTDYDVLVVWKAFDGTETTYGVVAAGGHDDFQTYEGHVWVFRAQNYDDPMTCGKALGVWDGKGVKPKLYKVVSLSQFRNAVKQMQCLPA